MKYATTIIDWKQTLYDPEEGSLIDGALELLPILRRVAERVVLIGKGEEDMYHAVETLGVGKFFDDILFVGSEKQPEHFQKYMSSPAEQTLVIGDKLSSEIELGNRLGAVTIQVKQGKFANEQPANKQQEPKFVFQNLRELADYISRD